MSLGSQRTSVQLNYIDHRFSCEYKRTPLLGKLGRSRKLRSALIDDAAMFDVFHTHGLWRYVNVYPARAAQNSHRPFVLSPMGMLAPSALRFSAISKQIFSALAQRKALASVSAFHATSEQEYIDIRGYGLTQPVAIIPHGIDIIDKIPTAQVPVGAATVLFLGRLHPIKALDRLLLAWRRIQEEFPDWALEIVGPSEGGYQDTLKKIVEDHGLRSVKFTGAVDGLEKQQLLQRAEVFALPSLSENFAIAVAESLAAGTPVIASKGTPWQGLDTHSCGWWVDNDVDTLVATLRDAMSRTTADRQAMGERGRAWMEQDFGWDGIARGMAAVYRWLAEGGERPDCVRVD